MRKSGLVWLAASLVLALLVGGCSPAPSSPSTTSPGVASSTNPPGTPTATPVKTQLSLPATLSLVAGNGQDNGPLGGQALDSPLDMPKGMAVDSAGNLFVGDWPYVKMIAPDGAVSVWAGNGTEGDPVPGPATDSPLSYPEVLAVDSADNVYIAVYGYVLKVSSSGVLSIVAGNGQGGDPVPGPATSSPTSATDLAIDSSGNLFFTAWSDTEPGAGYVVKVTPNGLLSIVAGNGKGDNPVPGAAANSPLQLPGGIAIDPSGNLFVVTQANTQYTSSFVVKISPDGQLSLVAGNGAGQGALTPGPATSSRLMIDYSGGTIACGTNGSIYFTAQDESSASPAFYVVMMAPDGTLSIIAGSGKYNAPVPGPALSSPMWVLGILAFDGVRGDLYVAMEDQSQEDTALSFIVKLS